MGITPIQGLNCFRKSIFELLLETISEAYGYATCAKCHTPKYCVYQLRVLWFYTMYTVYGVIIHYQYDTMLSSMVSIKETSYLYIQFLTPHPSSSIIMC